MKSSCKCVHESQDKMYGKQVRIFNRLGKPKPNGTHSCTVCGALKSIKEV